MQKTSGLGRGLSSLIPQKNQATPANSATDFGMAPNDPLVEILTEKEKVYQMPVEKITPNPYQPRQNFDEEGLEELAESIKEYGIIQPLILTKISDGEYQLIAGERRWRAAQLIGLKNVPAIIRDLDEQKKLELALIENLQRQDLNALEIGAAYRKLIDEFNLSLDQLAQKVGKSRSAVANTMRILNTVEEVKDAIRTGKITEGHARVLAGLPAEDQKNVLNKILQNSYNVREAEKAGKEVVVQKHIRNLRFDPEARAMEEKLQQVLATKVEVKRSGGAGQIIIKFFSDDEFREIMNKILS